MIGVFVVDDSAFVRKALARFLAMSERVRVVGAAETGADALRQLERRMPDVVTLDIGLPDIDGLALLKEIRARYPHLPVIMMSSRTREGAAETMRALSLGAVDFIDKTRFSMMDAGSLSIELASKIEAYCAPREGAVLPLPASGASPGRIPWSRYDLCVIGASTGGPEAIQAIMERMPADFPIPIAVVQHMLHGFTRAFAERLDSISRARIVEARSALRLEPGMVAIAPAGSQMTLDHDLTAVVTNRPSNTRHVPSVDVLMRSAAAMRPGRVVGVLLTGMGADGAEGMFELRRGGSLTIAQSQASCVVYGMPKAAVDRGGVDHSLSLEEICALFTGTPITWPPARGG